MILVGDREEVADLKRQEAVQKAAEDTESSAGKSAGDDSEEKSLQGTGEASTESEETQARE